ncbi:MAG: diaminopimelate decarboxylase [Nanoarchaeota archaeon]|nr:diaminopimelate decarboxylase [Nanoarchaeota archaeon]
MINETLLKLAKEYNTPLYVYDLKKVKEQINKLKKFIGIYPNIEFLYAIKANYNPHLTKEIVKQGFGIDAVSLEEVKLGILAGAKPQKIIFTGNNMTDIEMTEVHKLGVLLNIGSLSRLEKFGKKYPGSDVCVRFNPNIGYANHKYNITGGPNSKFGISYLQLDEVLKIIDEYNLNLIGIHEHIGSGWLKINAPLKALEIILEIASKLPSLKFIDLGGGFGIPYHPDENELDISKLGQKINERFTTFCKEYKRELKLILEPGRYIVCQAGHLLIEVNTIKKSPEGKIFVGTNSGMNHMIRVPLYNAHHEIINLSNSNGVIINYNICGNICESSDFFAHDRPISEIKEGDIISIKNTGAYGFVQACNYQFRPLPAEVVIDDDKIILSRKRETFEDLLKRYNLKE